MLRHAAALLTHTHTHQGTFPFPPSLLENDSQCPTFMERWVRKKLLSCTRVVPEKKRTDASWDLGMIPPMLRHVVKKMAPGSYIYPFHIHRSTSLFPDNEKPVRIHQLSNDSKLLSHSYDGLLNINFITREYPTMPPLYHHVCC